MSFFERGVWKGADTQFLLLPILCKMSLGQVGNQER